ncbi:MAG TPA: cytochrome c5 family protein [Piscirickettsiaceae bacterium]|jgi:cytochrome c5|nr:cytochrome c5 family protein [Piscirickettsiaceae bacterium]
MSDNSLHFKNSLIALIVIAAIIYGVNTFFTNLVTIKTVDTSTLEDRIKPIGQVYLEGDVDGTAVVAEKSVAVAKKSRSGESVYTTSCAGCHSIGVAGAPKFGNKADWASRLKRGMDDLVKVAISGKGAMPPKGTCATCSADELRAAIEHMVQ